MPPEADAPAVASAEGTVRRTRITLLERRSDLSRAAFDAHWSGPHVPLILGLPGIVSYVQHHVIGAAEAAPLGDGAFVVDGIVELSFDAPLKSAPAAHRSSEQEDDEPRFLSGLTGFTSLSPMVSASAFAVWTIGGAPPESVLSELPQPTIVHRRDEGAEPSVRATLQSVHPLPQGALVWEVTRANEARSLCERVRGALGGAHDGVAVVATRAVPFV